MRLQHLALLGFLQLTACTSNELVFSDKVTVDPITGQDGLPKYVQAQGQQPVSGSGRIQWFTCTQGPAAPTMVLLNPGPKPWSQDEVCKTAPALAFLNHGLNVVAINRPETETLGDDTSLNQVKETVDFLQKEGDRRLEGLWSLGEGSVLALRLARQYPWKVLIIGNGIYDLEMTLKDSADKDFLARVKAMTGSSNPSFVEKRSASWDLSGLPKVVYLYHGGRNAQVNSKQATQFRNSLAASEHKVELYILEEGTEDLRPDYHRGVLSKILENYQKPE
ncbi:alpha/beta fold hydrolase [Oligoflexus tunisiensis]|uniref:alpha/beta fold hydrolase n=1 Tax=Oligoflexus tunisiensis TaxID=708132 RepID=UPI00114CE9C1|nr:hypothetical protein [Oligoflexus tunisiensis]